jgi:DNA gyrase/topoisomerase IV subunit A
MNFLQQDLNWLLNEARNDPDVACQIIEALAGRVDTLQGQVDVARAENILLKRSGQHHIYLDQIQRLKSDLCSYRIYANSKGQNDEVITMITSNGMALQLPRLLTPTNLYSLEHANHDVLRDLRPIHWCANTRLGQILIMLSSGRAFMINGFQLPYSDHSDWAMARKDIAPPNKNERIEAICALPEGVEARLLVIVTRQGWVKAMPWGLFENMMASDQPLISIKEGDSVVWVGTCLNDKSDLIMISHKGRWLRFEISGIQPSGNMGLPLLPGDEIVCATEVLSNASHVYFIGADGALLAVSASGVPSNKRPGAKTSSVPKGFMPFGCVAGGRNLSLMTLSLDGNLNQSPLSRTLVSGSVGEAKPLNLMHQRLCAWAAY